MIEPLHCPYDHQNCRLEARYDTTAPSDEAVESIIDGVQDETEIAEIMNAASARIYRGESCQYCGAWFPADRVAG